MRITLALVLIAALVGVAPTLRAEEVRYPEPPGERAFLLDEAGLVSMPDAQAIVGVCTALLDEKRVPLLVVTLPSLAAYGAGHWTIERYARGLFDAWGIGFPDWNHGMLLLISEGDRKARIELGAAWGQRQDRHAQQIMDDVIVARFKEGRFSEGIREGVRALADVARGLGPPPPPPDARRPPGEASPGYRSAFWLGVVLFVVSSLVSIARRGRGGWGFKAWAAIFAVLGLLLMIVAFLNAHGGGGSSGGSSSGGGGGSFGGGFSGGGGASGSW